MTIAKEEIFGPVLSIPPYDPDEEVAEMANDTEYGLSGYVSGTDRKGQKWLADQSRNVHVNGADWILPPFGGYKQSGNGREWGEFGFEEFLELKAVMNSDAA